MGSPDSFGVRIDHSNGVAHVRIHGELDLATTPTLEANLFALEGDGVSAAILDLRELAFMDSTGLQALLDVWRRANENGHRLAIVGATERTRELFELTGTERILDGPAAIQLLEVFTGSASSPVGLNGDGSHGG
ncbi:MAG TPA: STAS domain-containing protein [Actinomycetota bacterium]|nr:STAS domain-containing protein [Actinomycetota bacterium]